MYKLLKVNKDYADELLKYRKLMLEACSSMDGCSSLEDYEDIAEWFEKVDRYSRRETCPKERCVSHQYMYIDDSTDEVVALGNIRLDIGENTFCNSYAGNIGYSVRPDKRIKGIGTRFLSDLLKECKAVYNMKEVIVTCFKDNAGSLMIIAYNGGRFDSELDYPFSENKKVLRYRIKI